jgi:hypothetical protein
MTRKEFLFSEIALYEYEIKQRSGQLARLKSELAEIESREFIAANEINA